MKKYLKKILKILSLQELRILPSYLSYNFVLAIIPTFTIILLIASIFSISSDSVISFIKNIVPSYIGNILTSIISSKNYSLSIGLLNLLTLYASSRGIYAVIESANNLYKVKEINRTKDRFKSIIVLLILIFTIIFLILIPVLGGKVLLLLEKYNIVTKSIIYLYHAFKWPITLFIIFISVILIYMIAPSIKLKVKDVLLGAFFTTIMWSIFTSIFSYYLTYFAKYDALYGGLSSITVLLIWIYFLSYILILGMIINTTLYNKETLS